MHTQERALTKYDGKGIPGIQVWETIDILERDWKRIKFLRAGRVLSKLRYAPAAQWAGSTSSTSQLQYAGCYSSIVAAFIANRLSADSLVL